MPFNIPITGEQQDILEGGGYSGRDYLLFCPQPVVFQCRPATDSSADVIAEFEYDNVTVGDYEDVRRDMTVLITTGTSLAALKRPLWRGRIRELPTADTLYINESSIGLDTDLYVTVLDTYDPVEVLRSGNSWDWDKPFEKLKPAIKGLSSSYVKEPVSGEAQFSFAPEAQAMEDGAAIDDETAWHWTIPGAVYDSGDEDSREITVTLPEGWRWAMVEVTDSNGVTGSFIFEIYVMSREDMVYIANDGAEITNDWDEGVNATVRYFAGVEDILDRTRCTIVTFERYREGDPEFPNVSFVGYLRQDTNETRGDANYSVIKERSFTIAGFAALMGETKLSQLTLLDKASPAAPDEMKLPNPARGIEHLRTRYATIGRLTCIDYGGTLSNDHYGGDMDVESTFLLDACNALAELIDARLIFAPDGQIIVRRNASLLTDDAERDALDTIMQIPSRLVTLVGYTHPHMPRLAQIQAGCRSYRTADKSSLAITATAPAIAFNEGDDFDEAPSVLLMANATEAEARDEAGKRVANHLAYRDEGDEWTFQLDDGQRWMQPSVHQWWNAIVPASAMSNNLALTEDDRLMLKSITHKCNPERGTRPVKVTFRRETKGGLAMVLVEVIPASVPTAIPPRPPLGAYLGAFPPRGTLNYTSQTPGRRQPYSGSSMASVSMPYSPAQQQRAGDEIVPLGCRVMRPALNFRNPSNVLTDFNTVNGETYLIRVRGSARISPGRWQQPEDFDDTDGGFTPVDSGGNPVAMYTPPWTRVYDNLGLGVSETRIEQTFAHTTNFLSVRARITSTSPTGQFYVYSPGSTEEGVVDVGICTNEWFLLNVNFTGDYLRIDLGPTSLLDTGDFVLTFHEIEVTGAGINPFTGTPGDGDLMGDPFYQWVDEGGEDEAAELYPATRGLRINSSPVAIPPEYNANHDYQMLHTGDGNPIPFGFADDDHTDNENAIFRILVCGPGAGT